MAPIAPDNDEEWEEFGNLPSVESIQAAILTNDTTTCSITTREGNVIRTSVVSAMNILCMKTIENG